MNECEPTTGLLVTLLIVLIVFCVTLTLFNDFAQTFRWGKRKDDESGKAKEDA